MTWEPENAPLPLEQMMEAKDLPESDRDELRRMAEFLRRMKDKKAGKELPPHPEMLKWIEGEE